MDSFPGGCGSRLAFLGLHWKPALLAPGRGPRSIVSRSGGSRNCISPDGRGGGQFWGGGTVERLDKYEVFLNCFRWADVCCWMVI